MIVCHQVGRKSLVVVVAAVLAASGCRQDAPDYYRVSEAAGATAVHQAVLKHDVKWLKYLLVNGRLSNNTITPLHFSACCDATDETARILLEYGADMNAKDITGRTPLHYAALQGNLRVATLLVNRGTDVNVLDDSRISPLHLAIFNADFKMAILFMLNGADPNVKAVGDLGTPVHLAVIRGEKANIELLVARGGDINALTDDDERKTPLDVSLDAHEGKEDEITELIRRLGGKRGAEIRGEDSGERRGNEKPRAAPAIEGDGPPTQETKDK